MSVIQIFQKAIYQLFEELYSWTFKLKLITPKNIIGTYFDTKLSMFGLSPSVTEEGTEGPQKGLKGPIAFHRS